ncbi:MAG TPA: hypothetical protein VLA77_03460 [Candidatus Saccharimonadales bacterium]|nr:hypothetical protein [Candidatus Saccharimonadales bacterium]
MKKNSTIVIILGVSIALIIAAVGFIFYKQKQVDQGCTTYYNSSGEELYKDCIN